MSVVYGVVYGTSKNMYDRRQSSKTEGTLQVSTTCPEQMFSSIDTQV